jgi:hypothetical protein
VEVNERRSVEVNKRRVWKLTGICTGTKLAEPSSRLIGGEQSQLRAAWRLNLVLALQTLHRRITLHQPYNAHIERVELQSFMMID